MKAYVVAAAMTRFGKYPDQSAAQLGRSLIPGLLGCVGLPPERVEAVYVGRSFSGALDGQIAVPGQVALHGTGIQDVPVYNFDNACAAAPSALSIAAQAVEAGAIDIALAAVLVVALVWGLTIVADSAQFSASVVELSEPEFIGTAVTVQTCLGFLLTALTIQLMPVAIEALTWRYAFAVLAAGPFLGVLAMWQLRRSPDAARLAHGKR